MNIVIDRSIQNPVLRSGDVVVFDGPTGATTYLVHTLFSEGGTQYQLVGLEGSGYGTGIHDSMESLERSLTSHKYIIYPAHIYELELVRRDRK